MNGDTLLSPETVADILRVIAVVLAGLSFGIALMLLPKLKLIWAREDLLTAQAFLIVHFLIALYVAGTLAEHAGDALTWRTPVALVAFTLKIALLALLRERVIGRDLHVDPPTRRIDDT